MAKKIGDTVYTIKEKDTNEYHLFEGKITKKTDKGFECDTNKRESSICGKLLTSENPKGYKYCLDENEARKIAYGLERSFCGICVSHLYLTFDDE